jgi:hypothetical protein
VCVRARACVCQSRNVGVCIHISYAFAMINFYTRMCCARSSAGKPLTSILSIDTNTSPGRTLPHCSAGLSRILKNKIDVDF